MENIKKILVTGATSGIGLHLVKVLLGKGNRVYAIGRDTVKITEFLANENFVFISLDLNRVETIESVLSEYLLGVKLDGFVNCAGIEETLPLSLYSNEKIKAIYNINVFSTIEILRIISKKKYSNDGASFVLTSSVMGELGQSGKIGYCSTKAAVLGLVKSSALEFSKRKIRVNAISPGVVNTPMTFKLFDSIDSDNKDRIVSMHPLGLGEVEDVCPLYVFLLSDDSRWITGQNIKIDGGYSIQ